jgi:uncharacterized repeat protein (TIGR02543 family)
MPNSDIVVSALFELCQYSITYSDMTEDMVNVNPDTYNINSIIELTEPVREGYKFLGWFDADGNAVTRIVGRTGDLVLTPKFELIEEEEEPNEPGQPDEPGDDNQGDVGNGDSNNKDDENGNGSEGNGNNNQGILQFLMTCYDF